MTIASEISRLQCAKADIRQAIIDKGVDVCANLTLDDYACCIADIPTGGGVANVSYLLLGGGGGGGSPWGGGGGAGGYICKENAFLSGCYTVTIGAGGGQNTNGGDSCFDGAIAYGGGAGGGGNGQNGCNGASGGGGGGCAATCRKNLSGGTGIFGQGCAGGTSYSCMNNFGAGGGGATGVGQSTNSKEYGGDGGTGIISCITGYNQCFAGGGGGGMQGNGKYGGGNHGANASTCGSGGGMCRNGGGGLLIIAYPCDCNYNISGANCCGVCNGICYHCFTSSGTLVVS